MAHRQFIHAMTHIARFKHIGHQHGVGEAHHVKAISLQHQHVIFEVLADFQHRLRSEQWFQGSQRSIAVDLPFQQSAFKQPVTLALMRQRHITGLAGCQRQGKSHDIGLHGIKRISFRIKGTETLLGCAGNPVLQLVQCGDGFIVRRAHGNGLEDGFDCRDMITPLTVIPAKAGIQLCFRFGACDQAGFPPSRE